MNVDKFMPYYPVVKPVNMNLFGERNVLLYIKSCYGFINCGFSSRRCIQMKVDITKDDKFRVNGNLVF